jgi:peroxiredoxin
LRQDYDKFVEQEAVILVVGPENREKFRAYWEVESLPYTGLPDPKARVLKLFGQEVNLFKLGRMPAQVIVDKQGTARYVHYGKSMQDIPANEELLQLLISLNAEKVS